MSKPDTADSSGLLQFAHDAAALLQQDERVLAIWLTGSLGRGVGDRYSDVDLRVAVRDEALQDFAAAWYHALDQISPTVFRQRFGPPSEPIITAITPNWLRFDLAIIPATLALQRSATQAAILFDRNDTFASVAPAAADASAQASAAVLAVIEEFLRCLGLLVVVAGRGEWLVAVDGGLRLRSLLIDLLLIANGRQRPGVKRLNSVLPPEQQQLLEQLPPLVATPAAVLGYHRACAQHFLPLARQFAGAQGIAYPERFEQATLDYLHRELGFDLAGE